MRRASRIHTVHRRLRIHHHHGNRIAIDRHRAAITAVVATVLQWLEIEAGFFVKGLKGQLLAQHPIICKRTGLPIGKVLQRDTFRRLPKQVFNPAELGRVDCIGGNLLRPFCRYSTFQRWQRQHFIILWPVFPCALEHTLHQLIELRHWLLGRQLVKGCCHQRMINLLRIGQAFPLT